uniref:Uncharacterized protein n=1 Tax=Ixodes ricinus TaxID=34613 RepID=A0A6B0VAI7_IXORI
MVRATASILATMLILRSYANRSLGRRSAQAFMRARPRSRAPSPPSAQWLQITASLAPAARLSSRRSSNSALLSDEKPLMATTAGRPSFPQFSMWRARLQKPWRSRGMFSQPYSGGSGDPSETGGPPPWTLRARSVATITTALGESPDARHLMSTNFSMPLSAPKPPSVTTYPRGPTSLRAIRSAMTDELPCAMLAKGPQWMSTGVPSRVCSSVGHDASRNSTSMAPAAPRSSAVTGSPWRLVPTTMRRRRSRRSCRSLASASTAITSLAGVMSNCVSRDTLHSAGPWPTVMRRRNRSFVSITLFQVMLAGSTSSLANRLICSGLSWSGSRSVGMPSLASLRFCDSVKYLAPLRGVTNRANRAASL